MGSQQILTAPMTFTLAQPMEVRQSVTPAMWVLQDKLNEWSQQWKGLAKPNFIAFWTLKDTRIATIYMR